MSARKSFTRSLSASMMVMHSSGAGVVPKGRHRKRKASFLTLEMHVDAIFAFAWMRWYVLLRSVLPIRMSFKGNLMRVAATMWIILRRQNP